MAPINRQTLRPLTTLTLLRPGCMTTVMMAAFLLITLTIVAPLLWFEGRILKEHATSNPLSPLHVAKRSLTSGDDSLTLQPSMKRDKILKLEFTEKHDGVVKFDLCSVIDCGSNEKGHTWSEKYICENSGNTGYHGGVWHSHCPYWSLVIANTGPVDWGYQPTRAGQGPNPLKKRLTLIKASPRYDCDPGSCNPLILTLKDPQPSDTGSYALGAWESGTDPLGLFLIHVTAPSNSSKLAAGSSTATDLNSLTVADVVEMETGFTQKNDWLEWVESAARTATRENCVVCSSPTPALLTVPSPFSDNETYCMLHLHMTQNPSGICKHLEAPYPLVSPRELPPMFTPIKNNHTCLTRFDALGSVMGDIPADWCRTIINVTAWANVTTLAYARSDVYWYCGNLLRNTLPPDWSGTCTILSLIAPITIVKASASEVASWQSTTHYDALQPHRHKRDAFDFYGNSPIYIDAFGVPRGVPDAYKLVNRVAPGADSRFFWVTGNKNVDRTSYIHYNGQRLNKMGRDAMAGQHKQWAASSPMTYQNRMALDFPLAQRGGVCAMFSEDCCTFIPDNTGPDGSVTRALSSLRDLSEEMARNSGINPLPIWVTCLLVILVIAGAAATFTLCCCCKTRIRHLCLKCTSNATDDRIPAPPPYELTEGKVSPGLPL